MREEERNNRCHVWGNGIVKFYIYMASNAETYKMYFSAAVLNQLKEAKKGHHKKINYILFIGGKTKG